jgi:predicted metal-dependent hydrolase
MRYLASQTPIEELSGAWCNADAVTSSAMEALSFVTPLLENFFIATVATSIVEKQDSEIHQRCRTFIREESTHSRVHRLFNNSLLKYLSRPPPGLALVKALLKGAGKGLPLSIRLLLVAALEHLAAVLSRAYVNLEAAWDIRSVFAREMFARHAREELAHRAVVFDLCLSEGAIGSIGRGLILGAILVAGLLYLSTAVPWILYRKNNLHLARTVSALARFARANQFGMSMYAEIREMFRFVRGDFHPDRLAVGS